MKKPYTHLLGADVPIWERFLEKFADDFTSFEYDVHVGNGITAPEDWPEEYRRMTKILSQKRIDVVAHKETELWIIEIKKEAGLGALGQVLGYILLHQQDFVTTKKLVGTIVTNFLQPDMEFLLEHFGLQHFIV